MAYYICIGIKYPPPQTIMTNLHENQTPNHNQVMTQIKNT
jgi:hypothetical protein